MAVFGEVLFDEFPDGQLILGGAPFNVAWHLQALGENPCFISRVGKDAMGDKIQQAMLAWGMAIDNLQIDSSHSTGTVRVRINNGEPDYEIMNNQAYDFITETQLNPLNRFNIIYHGTLALRSRITRQALDNLKTRQQSKIFIDVNLREPWWQAEQVNNLLSTADWVKLNQHELMRLTVPQSSLEKTMRLFQAQHDLDVLIITCGNQGAIAIDKTGECFEVKPAQHLSIVDTVGAGDAFAAILLLGIQQDWPLALSMARAQLFASALVTRQGATVQDANFYQPFISAWNLG